MAIVLIEIFQMFLSLKWKNFFLPELFFISKLDSLIDFKAGQDQVFFVLLLPYMKQVVWRRPRTGLEPFSAL